MDDTIVAISTPPGEGGIGIVRLSGAKSWSIASQIFKPVFKKNKTQYQNKPAHFPRPRRLYYGFIIDELENILDEVLLTYMPAPYTYTCEDIVEINAHGGAIPLKNILLLTMRKGARLAEAGEFTKRAYLNGRIDLLQAESVLAMIKAKTEKGLQAAIQSLRGNISKEIEGVRELLLNILAEIEAEVDFPDEDLQLEKMHFQQVKEKVIKISEQLKGFQKRQQQGKILQEGLKLVIIGKPNVGKSSLYNYLIREERAIVTEVPGTTRDLLKEYINLNGIPLQIIDTAGLRANGDKVEQIGMEYSRKAILDADLILFLLDVSTGITEEDSWIYDNLPSKGKQPLFVVANKIDRGKKISLPEIHQLFPCELALEVSILKKEGLKDLENAITELVYSGVAAGKESAIILEIRLNDLLEKAALSLQEALAALQQNIPLEMISIDLKQAYRYLGNLIGEETEAEILDYLFNRFCIGK